MLRRLFACLLSISRNVSMIVCFAAAAHSAALAEDRQTTASSETMNLLSSGEYGAALCKLSGLTFSADGKVKSEAMYGLWSQILPMVDDTHGGPHLADPNLRATSSTEEASDRASPVDAIREIAKRAAQTRIVILNEDHRNPRHRGFAADILRALRPLGYRLFAVETLAWSADQKANDAQRMRLEADGFVRLRDGFYTRDPAFGGLMRVALRLGYQPVAYDAELDLPSLDAYQHVAAREKSQSEILARKLIEHSVSDKIVIFVGFDHVAENPLPWPKREPMTWMAGRLKKLTGLDPLTIDQTTLSVPRSRTDRPGGEVRAGPKSRGPYILLKGGQPIVTGRYRDVVDLQVLHRTSEQSKNRAAWFAKTFGYKRDVVALGADCKLNPCIAQSFVVGEPEDTVPLYQELSRNGQANALKLPGKGMKVRIQRTCLSPTSATKGP